MSVRFWYPHGWMVPAFLLLAAGGTAPGQEGKPPEEDNRFRCELRSAHIQSSRAIWYNLEEKRRHRVDQSFHLELVVMGPLHEQLRLPYWGDPNPAGCRLTALKDDAGIDLLSTAGRIQWRFDRPRPETAVGAAGDQELATLAISQLPMPSAGAKALACLDGHVELELVTRRKEVALRPLAENLNKPVGFPGDITVTFTHIDGNTIYYEVSGAGTLAARVGRRGTINDVEIKILDGRGFELGDGSLSGMGSQDKAWRYSVGLREDLPADGCAIVRAPAETRKIRIPFHFENVPLP